MRSKSRQAEPGQDAQAGWVRELARAGAARLETKTSSGRELVQIDPSLGSGVLSDRDPKTETGR